MNQWSFIAMINVVLPPPHMLHVRRSSTPLGPPPLGKINVVTVADLVRRAAAMTLDRVRSLAVGLRRLNRIGTANVSSRLRDWLYFRS